MSNNSVDALPADIVRRLEAYDLVCAALTELLAAMDTPTFDHPTLKYVEVQVDRETIATARDALAVAKELK